MGTNGSGKVPTAHPKTYMLQFNQARFNLSSTENIKFNKQNSKNWILTHQLTPKLKNGNQSDSRIIFCAIEEDISENKVDWCRSLVSFLTNLLISFFNFEFHSFYKFSEKFNSIGFNRCSHVLLTSYKQPMICNNFKTRPYLRLEIGTRLKYIKVWIVKMNTKYKAVVALTSA